MRTDNLNVRSCRHCVWMVRLRPRPTFALALDNGNSGAKKKIKTCSVEKSSFIFYFMNQSTRCPLAQCIKSFFFFKLAQSPGQGFYGKLFFHHAGLLFFANKTPVGGAYGLLSVRCSGLTL